MSTDIVTRLRNFDRNTPFAKSLAEEGADEIERLRRSIEKYRQDVSGEDAPTHDGADEIERLRRSIEKHRQDVWGEDAPTHDADIALYGSLK